MLIARRLRARITSPIKRRLTKVSMARVYEVNVSPNRRELDGKVALVTGATGTIGRAIILRLVLEGATVIGIGRSLEKLNSLSDEVSSLGGTFTPMQVDLEDDAALSVALYSVARIDILVNCAGGSTRSEHAPVWEQSLDVVDRILRINLRAAITCTRAVAAKMVDQGYGRIISIGSIIGDHGKARFSEYAASKAGLRGYMKSAAIELGAHGITANLVSPGIVPRGARSHDELARIRETNVMGAICSEEDIAEAVLFFASDRSSFITGQDLAVDGGRSLGLRGDD
ncbi:SDR family NAD(P)-dependent oxidoreductase [Nesterenkonia jeotgali]|uniref:3-oxoacyl-[acyl-carrier protein] reductase n=1 Tax=Nesterenkonia jeotgali TaxID=317018 RepID=A0A839FRR5_9MICC|nr:SDR family NAD(P)-dependent oxidoreductase [Nesterenkonia jeotgali]MBA8921002.1 3-oxoacyl-[acyl-carrier protein] reductase [Nesterenkonia jeotgali]